MSQTDSHLSTFEIEVNSKESLTKIKDYIKSSK